MKIRRA